MELTIALRIWGFTLEELRVIFDLIDNSFNGYVIRTIKNNPEDNEIYRQIEMQLLVTA